MAYDGVLDDIRTIIGLGTPRRVPVFAMSEEFDVRWYGRGTYQEITSDASKLAACWIAAIREFDYDWAWLQIDDYYDWAWLQIDDCIEFEPLGVGVRGEGNILPATYDYLPAICSPVAILNLTGLSMVRWGSDGEDSRKIWWS